MANAPIDFLERSRDNKDQVIFTGKKLEIYIPDYYFKDEMAEFAGDKIITIGIFQMKNFKDEDSEKGVTYVYKFPQSMTFQFSDNYIGSTVNEDNNEVEKIHVFVLYNGDTFMETTKIARNYQNMQKLTKLHDGGRIPSQTKYSDMFFLYAQSMEINDSTLKMPMAVIEMMIAELTRSKSSLEVPFRKVINNPNFKGTEYDYKAISTKDLAMINSTFTAVTSEDMNRAIITGIKKARTGGKEKYTPIEKTIKY